MLHMRRLVYSLTLGSLRFGLELVCFPFFYHAALQRLGLVPARPLLPSWRTLIPFTSSSPLLPLSLHYDACSSGLDFFRAIVTSPVVLLCVEHSMERWIYACVYEAVESSIIRPDKPDTPHRDANGKDRALAVLGLRRQSPPLIRNAIQTVLAMLGWASPVTWPSTVQKQAIELAPTLDSRNDRTIDIGGTRVTNATPLNLPVVQTREESGSEPIDMGVINMQMDILEELMRSTTPPASTAESEQDENDPRIRITSREGIVEMEVRLPPRTLSTHTEVAEAFGSSRDHGAGDLSSAAHLADKKSYHRVTQLSCEPAQMISAMVRAQLVGLAMLPIRMVTLRTIASHYLASQGLHAGPHRSVSSLDFVNNFSWVGVGSLLSRIALCGALEMTIDLRLWEWQYLVITQLGQKVFGWGVL